MPVTKPSAAGLHFVVSTGVEKPNAELRQFIRSHVMLGKNKGKTRPPRNRGKVKDVRDVPCLGPDASLQSAVSAKDGELFGSSVSSTSASKPNPVFVLDLAVPRKFGSDVSTIRYADTVEPGTVEVVLQFSSIAKQVLFPLESCILFERRAETWIAPLVLDPAFLHAMVFTSQYYFDAVLPGTSWPTSQRSLPHFVKTLKLLRERLARDDDHARLSDTTAAAVMGIAGHALLTRDAKSARHHIEGLCKIVSLRGGVTTFRNSPKLLLEILRCDMGLALQTGSRPVFFHSPSHQNPLVPYPDLALLLNLRGPTATSSRYDSAMFLPDMDNELSKAWGIMSEFCSVINFAVDSGQRISTETFLDTMASVMYRLIDMRFTTGTSDEAVRLSLLAFACSVFLQWKHLGLPYSHLTSALRACLTSMTSSPIAAPELVVWLLMAGAVSLFDAADDRWLKPLLLANMGLCEIDSWSKMQHLLQSFMWIGLIHDKPAKRVFDYAITSPTRLNPVLGLPPASSIQ